MAVPYLDPPRSPGAWSYAMGIIHTATLCIGFPYRTGAAGPAAFDCSGLVWYCFAYNVDALQPRDKTPTSVKANATVHKWVTGTIASMGVAVKPGSELPGDLIMPSYHHVGICIGNNKYINAPDVGQLVRVSTYNPKSLYRIRRLVTPCSVESANSLTNNAAPPNQANPGREVGGDPGQVVAESPIDLVGDAVKGIGDTLADIGKVLGWLGDSHNWLRIGEVLGGGISLAIAAKIIASRVN